MFKLPFKTLFFFLNVYLFEPSTSDTDLSLISFHQSLFSWKICLYSPFMFIYTLSEEHTTIWHLLPLLNKNSSHCVLSPHGQKSVNISELILLDPVAILKSRLIHFKIPHTPPTPWLLWWYNLLVFLLALWFHILSCFILIIFLYISIYLNVSSRSYLASLPPHILSPLFLYFVKEISQICKMDEAS